MQDNKVVIKFDLCRSVVEAVEYFEALFSAALLLEAVLLALPGWSWTRQQVRAER